MVNFLIILAMFIVILATLIAIGLEKAEDNDDKT